MNQAAYATRKFYLHPIVDITAAAKRLGQKFGVTARTPKLEEENNLIIAYKKEYTQWP